MSNIYITEQGTTVGIKSNRIYLKNKNGKEKEIPILEVETISVFGNIQLTTQCISTCLKRGINVIFYSSTGSYFGRLISTNHVNVKRQRIQSHIEDKDDFKLELSKKIIKSKINNQIVLIRKKSDSENKEIQKNIEKMKKAMKSIDNVKSIEALMGEEGIAAKYFFKSLGSLVDEDFYFEKRTKRPPLDEFNSLLSLGYSILLDEIYGKIEGQGLNPYFGIMHKDKENHPTLASDLIEEWRSIIVEPVVLKLIERKEIIKEDFYKVNGKKGVFIKNNAIKKLIKELDKKLNAENKYLNYIEYPVSFRKAIDLQISRIIKSMESLDFKIYNPIMLR